jgi:hypothetical protein
MFQHGMALVRSKYVHDTLKLDLFLHLEFIISSTAVPLAVTQ